jgi:hypothetical protein
MEGYAFSCFQSSRRIIITSNEGGKIARISVEKGGASDDYQISDYTSAKLGPCKKIMETPILFSVTEGKALVNIENSSLVISLF